MTLGTNFLTWVVLERPYTDYAHGCHNNGKNIMYRRSNDERMYILYLYNFFFYCGYTKQ